jgi:hypothetical protein
MADENKSGFDLLGIQGISDSVRIATERTFDGAAAFLSRVCLPVAEEFGLLLRDRIRWMESAKRYAYFVLRERETQFQRGRPGKREPTSSAFA